MLFLALLIAAVLPESGARAGVLSTASRTNPVGRAGQLAPTTAGALAAFEPEPTFTLVPLNSATPLPSATPSPVPTMPPTLPPPDMPSPPPTATTLAVLPTPIGIYSETVRVPILMYHYVSEPPEDADKYRVDLSVSPENFYAQMQYLAEQGYTPINLDDLSLAVTARQALPDKPVILTFDDGYVDHYEYVFPILESFGFKGTFFIITGFVDDGNPSYMSWPMIHELAAAGHRMESHTRTHPDLSEATYEQAVEEILGSQQILEAHTGVRPRYLCYPGGRYDEETIAILEALDYWGAVTTGGGTWHGFDNRYEWLRVRIRYTTTLPIFADFLESFP